MSYTQRVGNALKSRAGSNALILSLIPEGLAHWEKHGDWTGLAMLIGPRMDTPTAKVVKAVIRKVAGNKVFKVDAKQPHGYAFNRDALSINPDVMAQLQEMVNAGTSILGKAVKDTFLAKPEREEKGPEPVEAAAPAPALASEAAPEAPAPAPTGREAVLLSALALSHEDQVWLRAALEAAAPLALPVPLAA